MSIQFNCTPGFIGTPAISLDKGKNLYFESLSIVDNIYDDSHSSFKSQT